MSKLRIKQAGFGVEIQSPWTTDLGNEKHVVLSVQEDGINVASTGTLNADGVAALGRALVIAKAIQVNGLEIIGNS